MKTLRFSLPLLAATALALFGCSSSDMPDEEAAVLPPLASALTTVDRMLAPGKTPVRATGPNPSLPANQAAYVQQGLGSWQEAPGEAPMSRTLDGSPTPTMGPGAKMLVRFAHLADLQLADDESPTRVGLIDSPTDLQSALRPQDAELCRMANAAVRTINARHLVKPLSFVLLGGDNADSAQDNEVGWVLSLLNGGQTVACDSGDRDDPVPGPGNDGKDAFRAEGLRMPWHWVTGNHDVLIQGNLPVSEAKRQEAVGTDAALGTRDYTQGGAIASGPFAVADARRRPLYRKELMDRIAADGDHGVGEAQRRSGKAFYTFDVAGTRLRFLVLDTASETGGASGMLHQADVDAYVKPALDAAKSEGKWVILSSHHAAEALTRDGGAFGTPQADAILPAAWTKLLGQYDNVVFSMVGHYHVHAARPVTTQAPRAYWEVITAAIADHPHQFREVEIWDGDNGWLMMRATCIDLSLKDDPVAEKGRKLGVMDYESGWWAEDPPGRREGRNVELWIKKP